MSQTMTHLQRIKPLTFMAAKCIKATMILRPTHGLNLNYRHFQSQTSSPDFFTFSEQNYLYSKIREFSYNIHTNDTHIIRFSLFVLVDLFRLNQIGHVG